MTFTLVECGVSTALAPGVDATHDALAASQLARRRNESFLGQDFQPQLCAFRNGNEIGRFADRARELLAEATEDFIARFTASPVALSDGHCNDVRLILILPEVDDAGGLDRASLSSLGQELGGALQAAITRGCDLRFSSTVLRAAGHAGIGSAIADCLSDLRPDEARTVMIVAVDSYSDRQRLNCLNDRKWLFSKQNQFGFVPGEAAGILLFAGPGKASSSLQVLGAANSLEATREYEEAESVFTALSDAAFAAAEMVLPKGRGRWINGWIADWNNSRYRATELSFAIHRLNPSCLQDGLAPVYPALQFGDVGAAYGCLAIILARSQRSFFTAFGEEPAQGDAAQGLRIMVSAGSVASGLRSSIIVSTH